MTDCRYSLLPDRGVVRVAGSDARSFLNAQTSAKFSESGGPDPTLAAWLSARGRVLALFGVVATPNGFLLVLPADNIESLISQLSRFVLRADVTLEPVPADAVAEPISAIEPAGAEQAALAEIAAGLPEVPATLRERYVPQMLNLERLGAVAFDKGCYPGQEVVARAQNLGQVKRRLYRFAVAAGTRPQADAAVTNAAGDKVGEINRVAETGSGFELLAVIQTDQADAKLTLAADGRVLERLPLPADSDAPAT